MNRNLSNCEKARKKKDFRASTGFEPVASALVGLPHQDIDYIVARPRSLSFLKEGLHSSRQRRVRGEEKESISATMIVFPF